MRRVLYIALLLLIVVNANAQNKLKITGIVRDGDNNPITGAVITIKEISRSGDATNSEGEYQLSAPSGTYILNIKSLGYEPLQQEVEVSRDMNLDFTLEESSIKLEEVVVSANSSAAKLQNVQIGVEQIDISAIAKMPALFGENDIIKSITLLPGVKSEGDGSSGYQVRGGTSSQNMILLDDASIYNSGHVLGIFSVFNDDALNSAALYKGQIPAMFGGATSSVLDIQSKSGNMDELKGGVTVGLLSTKAYLETPIVEDKLSLFVSGRRSYFDLFLKLTEDFKENQLYFYDFNIKLNYKAGEKDIVTLSYFSGRDLMGLDDIMSMGWGNDALTAKWLHRFSDKFSSTTSLIGTSYGTDNGIDIADIYCTFNGYIKNASFKQSFACDTENHSLRFGLQSSWIDLMSAEWVYNDFIESEVRQGWENSIWVNEQWKVSPKIELSAGLRLNGFMAMGGSPYYEFDDSGNITNTLNYSSGEVVESYWQLEPRMSLNWKLSSTQSLKLGYSRSSQNIHAIRNSSSMSMPFDRYTMSSNYVKPEVSDQIALGYIALTDNHDYEFSIEGYYKSIDNVYDYKDGSTFNTEIEIESLILGGEGRAYGAELSLKKNTGRFTGWIGYTLSWVETKIEGINNSQWYRASNDRRHDISVVGMYSIGGGWDASANFVFNTGQALTVPCAKYEVEGTTQFYYTERNSYNAPNYHRLDISFTHSKQKRNHVREWSIGCYNIYNHYNPYMIYFEESETSTTGIDAIQYSLFGIIPSISYGIKF